jgi:protoporphyrinogen oxidase
MKIAIIGAGFGGLAAAYDLKKAGHEVTIFESANYVGGLASGFKEPHWDWSVEKFYHHWFQSDSEMLGLIRELGLEDKVIFPRPLTVMYFKKIGIPSTRSSMRFAFPGLDLVSTRSASASSGCFCASRTTGARWKKSPPTSG